MSNNLLFGSFLWVLLCVSPVLSLAQVTASTDPTALRSAGDAASASASGAIIPPSAAELRAIKSQLQLFQQILNRDLQQTYEHPFALLQDAKGAYLPGFGVAFHMEVNLAALRAITPFDTRPYTAEELRKSKETKVLRIRQLKDRLGELLVEQSGELSVVPPEQAVVLVVHLFHLPYEQAEGLPTQLVLEASRRSLLDFKARRISAEDFRKQVAWLEF